MEKKPARAIALLPIGVFLVLYLGLGIVFEYVLKIKMGFYNIPIVVAFLAAILVACLQNRALSFDEKLEVMAKGVGDKNIMTMILIFLAAGVFVGVVGRSSAESVAYFMLAHIPARFAVAVLFVVLRWTRFGRSVYAVGGNSYSANMLAINVKRTKFLAHLICGILAGIGGFVYFLHVGSGSPSHASGAEMNAIAASIIGGTMLTGGVGNIIGTFFGVLSLSTIKNIVSSLGLDEAWWTNITVAGMICLFLVIQSLVLSRKNKDS